MSVINSVPQVPYKLSARLSNESGTKVIYFIDKNYGIQEGLDDRMNFKCIHPTRPNLCEILIPIERIDAS